MVQRLLREVKFFMEKQIVRGARFQLLFMASLILFVSITGGLLAYALTGSISDVGEGVWWAFLRMSDPGYLGNDEGALLRTISTIVTVCGYVLFMGSLIAIMTQWLNATMKKLESGVTPITVDNHILILGWTNRTISIVKELLLSQGRVRRFLRRIGASRLHIVILTAELKKEALQELRDHLGTLYNRRFITLRTGNALNMEHLKRVDFLHAAAIIIPGTDFITSGTDVVDTWTIKTLLSIENYGLATGHKLPAVIAEIFDARKVTTAQSAYRHGPLWLVASDAIICRLIAQNVRHAGLSHIYNEVLAYGEGNELYIRRLPQLAESACEELHSAFPYALLLGVLRPAKDGYIPHLNPSPRFTVARDDLFVLLARSYDETEPENVWSREKSIHQQPLHSAVQRAGQRILVLGWSRKVPVLVKEFSGYADERFQIDIFSQVAPEERERMMKRYGEEIAGVDVRHMHGDYTVKQELAAVDLSAYDNLVFVASDWVTTDEEADARTILGYLLLKDCVDEKKHKPEVLLELMDPDNERLFPKRADEVLISPLIVSHILAHVALRPELNMVFEELFTPGGAEIVFRQAREYGLQDRSPAFSEIQRIAYERGETALGIRSRSGRSDEAEETVSLNPPHDSQWKLKENDQLIVLTTY